MQPPPSHGNLQEHSFLLFRYSGYYSLIIVLTRGSLELLGVVSHSDGFQILRGEALGLLALEVMFILWHALGFCGAARLACPSKSTALSPISIGACIDFQGPA